MESVCMDAPDARHSPEGYDGADSNPHATCVWCGDGITYNGGRWVSEA